MSEIPHSKKTYPWVGPDHPDFEWTPGANVQRTWRKYGWVPPSESMAPPPQIKLPEQEPPKKAVRRVK